MHWEGALLLSHYRWGSRDSGRSDNLLKVTWLRQQTWDLNLDLQEPHLCPTHISGYSHLAVVILEPGLIEGVVRMMGLWSCPKE